MQDQGDPPWAQILVYLNLNEIQPQKIYWWTVVIYINKDINMKKALFLFTYWLSLVKKKKPKKNLYTHYLPKKLHKRQWN
jgi:hypothetical protein